MAYNWQVKDCKCRCGNEFRDLVNMDDTVRLTAHSRPRVRMECDTCLAIRIGQPAMEEYKHHKTLLIKNIADRAKLSADVINSNSPTH